MRSLRIRVVDWFARHFGKIPLISIGGRWLLMLLELRGKTVKDQIRLLRDFLVDLLHVVKKPGRLRNPQTYSPMLLVNSEGMVFAPRPFSDDAYHMMPLRERDVEVFIREMLKQRTGIFVDAGANAGYYTLLACKYGVPTIAIEAHPETFEVLQRNVSLNACGSKVDLVNRALWNVSREKVFLESEASQYGGAHVVAGSVSSWEVETTTLDDLCSGHEIRLIKMDIEGSELAALEGAKETLKHTHALAIEIGRPEHRDPLAHLLQSCGFSVRPARFSTYILAFRSQTK